MEQGSENVESDKHTEKDEHGGVNKGLEAHRQENPPADNQLKNMGLQCKEDTASAHQKRKHVQQPVRGLGYEVQERTTGFRRQRSRRRESDDDLGKY